MIATLWERIHEKQPDLRSIKSIAIACRHLGDPSLAHRIMDEWQREHPEDSVQLAKFAFKYLMDPRKAASLLEMYIAGGPSDKRAERYLRKVQEELQ